MKKEMVLFLYGKVADKNKALYYCNLHKCHISKKQLFEKKFKCKYCKHSQEMEKT